MSPWFYALVAVWWVVEAVLVLDGKWPNAAVNAVIMFVCFIAGSGGKVSPMASVRVIFFVPLLRKLGKIRTRNPKPWPQIHGEPGGVFSAENLIISKREARQRGENIAG